MVFIDCTQHTAILLRMTPRTATFITTIHGQRKIRNLSIVEFKKQFKKLDKPVAEVVDIWLRSTIKLTDRVKRELDMAKKAEEVEEVVEAEAKVRNHAKKGEGKNAYIAPDATFKALENKRHRGESIRIRVWGSLNKFESATCADVAADLGLEEKVVIGNLRSLVADGKASVVA